MRKEIYLDDPNIGELEKRNLERAIDSGYVSTSGTFVPEFEKKLAKYLGAKETVATQSGTSAIHMALYELGIGAGDEVIVPALTFVASVNPIVYVGAKPVFVDADIETWNIDSKDIIKNITKNTKAIIPVHLYGNPCNMDEILHIAKKHNLYIIEDATESLGARYKGSFTGTFGDLGCFSFNGNKIITTGGGGAIVSNDIARLKHIKFLINQAKDESNESYHREIGFNNRMTNLEAALGLAQMKRLDEFLEKKRIFNNIYQEELKGVENVQFQEEYAQAKSSWWLSCILFKEEVNITALQGLLSKKGIPTRRTFMPIVEFPPYQSYKQNDYKNSYTIFAKGLCLPSSILNSEDDIYFVCKALKEII